VPCVRAELEGHHRNVARAESAISAALAKKIRPVEPLSMLKLNAEAQFRKFYAKQVLLSVPYSSGL